MKQWRLRIAAAGHEPGDFSLLPADQSGYSIKSFKFVNGPDGPECVIEFEDETITTQEKARIRQDLKDGAIVGFIISPVER